MEKRDDVQTARAECPTHGVYEADLPHCPECQPAEHAGEPLVAPALPACCRRAVQSVVRRFPAKIARCQEETEPASDVVTGVSGTCPQCGRMLELGVNGVWRRGAEGASFNPTDPGGRRR